MESAASSIPAGPYDPSWFWPAAVALILFIAAIETFRPRSSESRAATPIRWLENIGLTVLSNAVVLVLLRTGSFLWAWQMSQAHFGLFNVFPVPAWMSFAAAFLVLDGERYLEHRLLHAIPLLWRLHQVHHSDVDYDVTTGLRFHPLEVLVKQCLYLGVIALFGLPAMAIAIVEAVTMVVDLTVHGNIALPNRLEWLMRLFVVSPGMHRIHHSDIYAEQQTNFGVVFPWWDRLFGTYLQDPELGQDHMSVGLAETGRVGFIGSLLLPFRPLPAPVTAAPAPSVQSQSLQTK
jgi:sterol desaturase/sphingolipid hydroxylase (fatty acid hydroxylase superfamily)